MWNDDGGVLEMEHFIDTFQYENREDDAIVVFCDLVAIFLGEKTAKMFLVTNKMKNICITDEIKGIFQMFNNQRLLDVCNVIPKLPYLQVKEQLIDETPPGEYELKKLVQGALGKLYNKDFNAPKLLVVSLEGEMSVL